MERKKIIEQLKGYFKIQDLVCPHTYNKWGEQSWNFITTRALHTLLWVRTLVDKGVLINNYATNNGKYSQRGLRCNLCQLVKDKTAKGQHYMSQHQMGNGFDLTILGMDAESVRNVVRKNKDTAPYPFRLERSVSWIHIDCMDMANNQKLNEFNP